MDVDMDVDAAKDCKSAAGSASIRRIKWISWMRVGVAKAYVRGEIVLLMWLRSEEHSLRYTLFLYICIYFLFCCWFSHMVFHNAHPVAAVAWPWETGKLAKETVAGCTLHGGQPSDWLMVWEMLEYCICRTIKSCLYSITAYQVSCDRTRRFLYQNLRYSKLILVSFCP